MSAGSALLNARAIIAALDLARGAHIADFACGRTGHFAFSAAGEVGEEGKVYAVDILREVIAVLEGTKAVRRLPNVIPVWGDVEQDGGVAIPAASLDVALLVHALGSFRQHETAVREVRRLMKPGGRVVVIDWRHDTRHPLAKLTDVRPPAHMSDALFSHNSCVKCGEFTPSPWHFGRIYSA